MNERGCLLLMLEVSSISAWCITNDVSGTPEPDGMICLFRIPSGITTHTLSSRIPVANGSWSSTSRNIRRKRNTGNKKAAWKVKTGIAVAWLQLSFHLITSFQEIGWLSLYVKHPIWHHSVALWCDSLEIGGLEVRSWVLTRCSYIYYLPTSRKKHDSRYESK